MPHRTVGIQFVRTKKKGKTKQQDMEKEKTYNEAIAGDEGFNEGEGYPSCEGQPCANVADESGGQSDIMTEDADSAQFAEAEKQAAEENTAETDGAETLRAEIDLRLAIARALVKINPEDKSALRAEGFMTRDPRTVERKKPGQPKARKRFQFSKR